MRITFWGVQGSCPISPDPHSVEEYRRRVAVHTLAGVIEDLQRLEAQGHASVAELLGGPPTPAAIEACQRRIGLPHLPFYAGETTCVEVHTSEGNRIIFDAGSGIRRCSLEICSDWQTRADRTLHLFGTHEHLDHRSGLSFARFCYVRDNPFNINVYGSHAFLHALDQHFGVFSHQVGETTYVDDPIDYTLMAAKFSGVQLRPADQPDHPSSPYWPSRSIAQPIQIGSTTVVPFEVYHANTLCLAYKLIHNGKTFIFCTDHELRHGDDPTHPGQVRSAAAESRLLEHCRNADLAYFDGQYFLDEYLGRSGIGSSPAVKRLDWGHSCVEDAISRARQSNIGRTLIGHHDPERTWPQRAELDRKLTAISAGQPNQIQLADGEMVVDL